MEMKSLMMITTMFFLLVVATPSLSSSKGGSENKNGDMDISLSSKEIVYEIDYRGPETHSSHISPPNHDDYSHGRRPWIIHHHNLQPKQPPNSYHPLIKGRKVGA